MSKLTLSFRLYGTLVARILMGGMFLLAGINKLQTVPKTAECIGTVLPAPDVLVWLVILVEIVLGVALIVGYKTSKSALGLAVFVILVTLLYHEWMDGSFMKNIGILAGLLYMVAYGPGDGWSLANRTPKIASTKSTPATPEQTNFTV